MTPKLRRRKNHRKIPRDDHYLDTSRSQSPCSSKDMSKDDDGSYTDSESMTNAPSDPKSIPESINSYNTKASLNSATNSPNFSQPNSQTTSYINIAPLPIFRGDPNECPVTHLSRFIKVCRADNVSTVDMMMRIFPVTLENEAALWYDLNIEPYPMLTWEEIKSTFLEAYHKIELIDELRAELMMINQDNKSVRSYFLRLQWILKRWPDHGLSDGLLKGIFVDGLRQDFQDWIIPQQPNSLNEALRLAFSFEQVQSIRGGLQSKELLLKCGFCEGMHEEGRCEIRERMRELWLSSKEEELRGSLVKSGSDGVVKEFVRSDSVGASSVVEKNEGEEGRLLGWKKKSTTQCQCSKHQCRNKQLERNNSVVTQNSNAE